MVCRFIGGTKINNFKAQVAPGVEPAIFENVQGMVVQNAPVLDPPKAKEPIAKKKR